MRMHMHAHACMHTYLIVSIGECPRSTCTDLRLCSSPWDATGGLRSRRRAHERVVSGHADTLAHNEELTKERGAGRRGMTKSRAMSRWRWGVGWSGSNGGEDGHSEGLDSTGEEKTDDEEQIGEEEGRYELRAFSEKAYFVVFKVVGYKAAAVQAAIDVLECLRSECKERPLRCVGCCMDERGDARTLALV